MSQSSKLSIYQPLFLLHNILLKLLLIKTFVTQEVEPRDLNCSFGQAKKATRRLGWSRHSLCHSYYRRTDDGRSVRQDHTSLSLRPDQGGTCLAHNSKLHYLRVYVQREKVKKQSHRTRSRSQKEIRRELQSISKAVHIPSGQGPSGQPSSTGVRVALSSTTPQHYIQYSRNTYF